MVDDRPAHYPGMSKGEARVWRQFMLSGNLPAGDLYYNVRVGNPIPAEPGAATWVSVVRNATSRKRLDAVVNGTDWWWLFEVKIRAGLSAIGETIGYEYLFNVAIAGDKPVVEVIVCDYVSRDVDVIAEHEGIGLFVVQWYPTPKWIPPGLAGLYPRKGR